MQDCNPNYGKMVLMKSEQITPTIAKKLSFLVDGWMMVVMK